MNIQELKTNLTSRDIPVISLEPISAASDGEIRITDRIHIQVGRGYSHVIYETTDGCYQYMTMDNYKTITDMISDIREAADETGEIL